METHPPQTTQPQEDSGASIGALPPRPVLRSRHVHVATAAKLNVELRKARGEVHGFNDNVAVIVPAVLGSMQFFWVCVVLALCSLPAVATAVDSELHLGIGLASFFPSFLIKASLIALVAWIAQTFVQLVALPVLQVSNNAQMALAEEHTAVILDRLDCDTAGGLRTIIDAIDALPSKLDGRQGDPGSGGPRNAR